MEHPPDESGLHECSAGVVDLWHNTQVHNRCSQRYTAIAIGRLYATMPRCLLYSLCVNDAAEVRRGTGGAGVHAHLHSLLTHIVWSCGRAPLRL